MNRKWYVGTLLIILAFIGLNQEQTKAANQQIVLQFTDVEMTSLTARDYALAIVIKKLETFGIANVEISEKGDSQLSIRYYSAIDALSVRDLLSQDNDLSLTYTGLDRLPADEPSDQFAKVFSIVVLDLQQQSDDGLGLNGKLAFELNQDYNRFFNPVVFLGNESMVLEQNAIVQVAFKINSVVAVAIDNTLCTIPEVRAGPSLV